MRTPPLSRWPEGPFFLTTPEPHATAPEVPAPMPSQTSCHCTAPAFSSHPAAEAAPHEPQSAHRTFPRSDPVSAPKPSADQTSLPDKHGLAALPVPPE